MAYRYTAPTRSAPRTAVGADRRRCAGTSPDRDPHDQRVNLHPYPDLRGEFFPHAAQAIKLVRRRRPQRPGGRWKTVTVYTITSLNTFQTDPVLLAGWIRGR